MFSAWDWIALLSLNWMLTCLPKTAYKKFVLEITVTAVANSFEYLVVICWKLAEASIPNDVLSVSLVNGPVKYIIPKWMSPPSPHHSGSWHGRVRVLTHWYGIFSTTLEKKPEMKPRIANSSIAFPTHHTLQMKQIVSSQAFNTVDEVCKKVLARHSNKKTRCAQSRSQRKQEIEEASP